MEITWLPHPSNPQYWYAGYYGTELIATICSYEHDVLALSPAVGGILTGDIKLNWAIHKIQKNEAVTRLKAVASGFVVRS